jgi:hypothetical protein
LTSGLFAVAAGTELKKGPRGLPTVEEAAARYPDPRHRFLSIGADALNETEAISLVLGERDYHLATPLLVSFGSLTALSRASLAQLSPLLGKARAMRLMAAFRLGPLSSLGQLAGAPIDSPERVYELFAQELRLADREILAVALLDTSASLLCALPDLMAPVTRETSCVLLAWKIKPPFVSGKISLYGSLALRSHSRAVPSSLPVTTQRSIVRTPHKHLRIRGGALAPESLPVAPASSATRTL